MGFDASRSNPKYNSNTTEVRPTNVSAFYYIKATTEYNPSSSAELQMVLAEIHSANIELQTTYTQMQELKDELQSMDYVIDSWIAANNSMWYRKYKSGWIEQGGITPETSTPLGTGTPVNQLITLPVPMKDSSYLDGGVQLTARRRISVYVTNTTIYSQQRSSPTVLAIYVGATANTSDLRRTSWWVRGMSAQ